ncbi:hypothetical protein EPJ66_00750 [Brachyspira aalborgi]|uniref:Uncharacterized protein n=1 Tax=Brachyspira aalborgi TaxID=29522 RepID=A0A5C8G8C0_9SPIR|nr:hypothetical protein [Brachyspira aalborgi]TXJ54303.1 hypothetical protein EPJ66_00750 [Brachyspira aalborgi]TXJ58195.1 hypothetical protein EPJ76_01725 [Brachyspira aalborgi]
MVKIKPESQINENELLSKSLICRQNIVRELRNNKENFNGIIRIYKDYIKKLINNEIIDFELPDLIKLNVPDDKISKLETKIIKEFEKALKTKFKIIK